jgi:hypothetical protein
MFRSFSVTDLIIAHKILYTFANVDKVTFKKLATLCESHHTGAVLVRGLFQT